MRQQWHCVYMSNVKDLSTRSLKIKQFWNKYILNSSHFIKNLKIDTFITKIVRENYFLTKIPVRDHFLISWPMCLEILTSFMKYKILWQWCQKLLYFLIDLSHNYKAYHSLFTTNLVLERLNFMFVDFDKVIWVT